jgi:hypothetical protein
MPESRFSPLLKSSFMFLDKVLQYSLDTSYKFLVIFMSENFLSASYQSLSRNNEQDYDKLD